LRSEVNKLVEKGLSTEWRKTARQGFRSLGKVLGLFQIEKWQFKEPVRGVGALSAHSATVTGAGTVLTPGTGDQQIPGLLSTGQEDLSDESIEAKLAERIEAKKRKDFAQADKIRTELKSLGIIIEDKPDGTSRWKR